MADQCPLCGRVSEDWSSNRAQGTKGKQRKDREDRAAGYREWRQAFGGGCYVEDVDQVEWRKGVSGELCPVATLELTRLDGNRNPPATYLQNILARFGERDFQATHSRHVAGALGVSCFVVLFRWDLSEFWIYNLSEKRGWWHLTQDRYMRWLRQGF